MIRDVKYCFSLCISGPAEWDFNELYNSKTKHLGTSLLNQDTIQSLYLIMLPGVVLKYVLPVSSYRLLAVKLLSDPLDFSKMETSLVLAKVLSIALNLTP